MPPSIGARAATARGQQVGQEQEMPAGSVMLLQLWKEPVQADEPRQSQVALPLHEAGIPTQWYWVPICVW